MKVKTNKNIIDERSSKLPIRFNRFIEANNDSPCYNILNKTIQELILDPEYNVESTIKDTKDYQEIKLSITDNSNNIKAKLSITQRKENNNG